MTRTANRVAVLFFALMIAVSGALVLQGAVAQEAGNDSTDGGADDAQSLNVVSLTAPESAAPGSNVSVAAEIENPTDNRLTEIVEFRIDGTVVDAGPVTVGPNNSTVAEFQAETTDFDAGTYYSGVFTADDGQIERITLSESLALGSVEAPENASVGDELTVEADVSNPNEFEVNQSVVVRLDGQAVNEERVTIDGGENETVTFTVDTSDREAGDYALGVFTRDAGQFFQFSLEDAAVEEPVNETETPANATETEASVNETGTETEVSINETGTETETEVPVNETETEVPVNETETEAPVNETETAANATETEVPLNETEAGAPANETEAATNETETEAEEPVDGTAGAASAADGEAAVEFPLASGDGTTVTLDSVTLSDGGYVAIHDERLLADVATVDENRTVESVVGVSSYLEPGTHENVTITLFEVPGTNVSESALAESQKLIAMPHLETNENGSFDFVATNGSEDGAYTIDGDPVVEPSFYELEAGESSEAVNETEVEASANDTEVEAATNDTEVEAATNETETEAEEPADATETETPANETETEVSVNETADESQTAETAPENATEEPATDTEPGESEEVVTVTAATSVTFENQTANLTENGTTVTIDSVTLRQGGYVAVHNESLLDGDAVGSVVGVSEYLEPGTYEDLSVVLFNVSGAEFDDTELQGNETLIAMAHLETNDNQTYDFVATNGTADGPYTEDGEPVIENATVAPANGTVGETTDETAAVSVP